MTRGKERSTHRPGDTAPQSPGALSLPVLYRGAHMVSVIYATNLRDANESLGEAGVTAVSIAADRALLTLSWFQYPESSIGPYAELAVAILARADGDQGRLPLLRAWLGDRQIAGYVLHLPVTSEVACTGGRERFGFPKTLAEINYERQADGCLAELRSGGQRILTMRIPKRRSVPVPLAQLATFSVLNQTLLHARVPIHGATPRLSSARGTVLTLDAPATPIARTLRALIGSRRALGVLSVHGFDAELHAGFPVRALGR